MKYFSLFSGIGGFELGIQQAYVALTNRNKNARGKKDTGKNAKKRTRLESPPRQEVGAEIGWNRKLSDRGNDKRTPTCVGYSEIDKNAVQIYQEHFLNHKNYGDITKINEATLPDFDLLVGGFPCQSFSIAGKRKGFDDTRGTLFFDIARILQAKQPRLFLLENVKGLLSHDNGNTFATIISTLTELGYDLEWQVLNSKNFGVPQNRERVFIVGHLRGTTGPKVFPITESSGLYPKEITQNVSDAQRIYTTNCAKTLKSLGGVLGAKTGLYAVPDVSYSIGATYYKGVNSGSQGGKSSIEKGKRQIIIEDKKGNKNWTIRRLTPLECERLQGFPDGWTEYGVKQSTQFMSLVGTRTKISDTQRYKCCGNAVTVNVVQAIMERLYRT